MFPPEKIAAVYLRLNQFFLFPYFTLLSSERAKSDTPRHSDFLAIRMRGATERVGSSYLISDNTFIQRQEMSEGPIRLAGEVKGGRKLGPELKPQVRSHFDKVIDYAHRIFGNESTNIRKVLFCNQNNCFSRNRDIECVSLRHCL